MSAERTSSGEAAPGAFGDRLARAVTQRESCLVAGFDPALDLLPPDLAQPLAEAATRGAGTATLAAAACEVVEQFGRDYIELCAPWAVAVKFQLAYFEQLGACGWEVLGHLIRMARRAGLITIADAKRADITSTAAAYAAALMGGAEIDGVRRLPGLEADAVTVNPYLGDDGVLPFLQRADPEGRGVFVVVYTSNPSADRVQGLSLEGGGRVADAVAGAVLQWAQSRRGSSGYSSVGAVVGATRPLEVRRLRERLGRVWLLLPGVGAQGADLQALRPAFDERGLGALVTASRTLMGAWRGGARRGEAGEAPTDVSGSWRQAIAHAARQLHQQLRALQEG